MTDQRDDEFTTAMTALVRAIVLFNDYRSDAAVEWVNLKLLQLKEVSYDPEKYAELLTATLESKH